MARGQNPNSRKNLIVNSERTPKQRKAQAVKAGKKSGEVREIKKSFREQLREQLTIEDIRIINSRLIAMAKHGNLKAYELIRDMLGEKPADKLEITGNINIADTLKAARERARAAKEKGNDESCKEENIRIVG